MSIAARPHHPGRRRHDQRRVEASQRHADDAAAALRAVGAPELELPRDRLHARTAATGRRCTDGDARPDRLVPVVVLRRRGAGGDAVLGLVHGLRGPERGGLPHDPAGRRGAPRPALQQLLRAGRSATTGPSSSASTGAARTSTRPSRLFDEHARRGQPTLIDGPARPRGQGRLRDDLPHGHRGDARAHRPVLPDASGSRTTGVLPGFLEGFRRISQDEHRHVAYGTWYLQRKAARPGARPGASRTR